MRDGLQISIQALYYYKLSTCLYMTISMKLISIQALYDYKHDGYDKNYYPDQFQFKHCTIISLVTHVYNVPNFYFNSSIVRL